MMQKSRGCSRNQSRKGAVPGRAIPEGCEQQHRKQRSIHDREDQNHRIKQAAESQCCTPRTEGKQHAAQRGPSCHGEQPFVSGVAGKRGSERCRT